MVIQEWPRISAFDSFGEADPLPAPRSGLQAPRAALRCNPGGLGLSLSQLVDKSSLTPVERQVAILAISRFNECHYCVAAHSVIADAHGASEDVVDAIRNDRAIDDARLEALRTFARRVVEKRGWVAESEIAEVQSAGFTNAQVLEVVLAAAMKTLSN